jgi:hypothetical protein
MAGFLGGGYDPWQYTEHRVSNTSVNSTELTTLMSVAGKGYLEETILNCYSTTDTTTTVRELKITIDGTVIYDVVDASVGSTNYPRGVINTGSIAYGTSSSLIFSFGDMLSGVPSAPNLSPISFPYSGQQSKDRSLSYIAIISQPMYFSASLLIQVKGVSSGLLQAAAKARY